MYTNRGTNVPRTSLPCPPRYGNSTRRRFAKALGANHLLVYYRSGGGSTGLRQVRPPLLSHTILTRETGTKIHMYYNMKLLYTVQYNVMYKYIFYHALYSVRVSISYYMLHVAMLVLLIDYSSMYKSYASESFLYSGTATQ